MSIDKYPEVRASYIKMDWELHRAHLNFDRVLWLYASCYCFS